MRILLLGLSVVCFVIALPSLALLLSVACFAIALPSLAALDEVLLLAIVALTIATELGLWLFSLSRKYQEKPTGTAGSGRVLLWAFSLTCFLLAAVRLSDLNRSLSLGRIVALVIPLVLGVRLFSLARQYKDEPKEAVKGILHLAYAVAVILVLLGTAVIAISCTAGAMDPRALGRGAALATTGVLAFVIVWHHDRAMTQQTAG